MEFAVDGKGRFTFYRFVLWCCAAPADLGQQAETLGRIYQKGRIRQRVKPYLHGKRTIYGVMPDWNPLRKLPACVASGLHCQLYKRLVTDGVWAYQRNNYGYKTCAAFR